MYGWRGVANSSSTGACSTGRPAYMTRTRSAMSATTPRSCVMRTIAVPRRSRSDWRTSRMPACTVTSRAVVGSSAMRTAGSQATAMAIITRWRIPPESWCGYSSTRWAGAGMPTRSRSSTARARASFLLRPWWRRSTSPICRPMVRTGFREVIGSWKIIAMSLPRIFPYALSSPPASSRVPSLIDPVMCAVGGSRPMTAMEVTDLPQPDSPTTARTSPAARSNETWSTAWTVRASVRNETDRSRTLSTASGFGLIGSLHGGRVRRAGRRRAG